MGRHSSLIPASRVLASAARVFLGLAFTFFPFSPSFVWGAHVGTR